MDTFERLICDDDEVKLMGSLNGMEQKKDVLYFMFSANFRDWL